MCTYMKSGNGLRVSETPQSLNISPFRRTKPGRLHLWNVYAIQVKLAWSQYQKNCKFKWLAATALCLSLFLADVNGETIVYTFKGVGNGTFGGVPFNGSQFALSVFADTTNVVQSSGLSTVNGWASAVGIDGIGCGNFITGKSVFDSSGLNALGLSEAGGSDMLDLISPVFASYNLLSPFGPVGPFSPQPGTLGINEATTSGQVDFSSLGNIFFEVSVGDTSPPRFLLEPTNQVVMAGNPATLTGSVIAVQPIAYQWLMSGTNLPGMVNSNLSITDVQSANAGDYAIVVTNQFGAVKSQVATVTVLPVAPVLTLQPLSQSVILGSNVTLTAAGKGSEPLRWQWYLGGNVLADATNAVLTITNIPTTDGGDYVAIISNQVGVATSQVAVVTIIATPVFPTQPVSQCASFGSTVDFAAAVETPLPFGWQWYFNGTEITGATSGTLTISNVQTSSFGNYWAVVTNAFGSSTSTVATLSYAPVVAWGDSRLGQTIVPVAATNVIALAGGDFHNIVLRRDNTVLAFGCDCWFVQYPGPIDVSAEGTNIVQIAAGSADSLGVRADGTVLLWGFLLGDTTNTIPLEATNVAAMALGCGAQHALALRRDGSVVDWGSNPNLVSTNIPPTATNIVGVSAGSYHSIAVRADGTVISWGDQGQASVPASATNIVAVASGWYQNLGLCADGTLVGWGTGVGTITTSNVVAIACGGHHDLALHANGTVSAWGDNTYGQSIVPTWATNIVGIAGTSFDSLGLVGDGPPVVTCPLVNRSILTGRTVYFYATAVGATPLSYQWQFNGTNVAGATKPILAVTNAQATQAGGYSVIVSNALGVATSSTALLTVLPRVAIIQSSSLTLTNGQLGFVASSATGLIWSVQSSSNLLQWVDVAVLTNKTGTMTFIGPVTNLTQAFYRLRLAP